MRSERMAERMWMQIPFHLHHARILFHNGVDGARFEPRAAHAEENSLGIAAFGPLGANLIAHRPVRLQRLQRLIAKGDDALLAAFAEHADDLRTLVDIAEAESGQFAYTNSRGVEQLQNGAIALQDEQLALTAHRTRIAAQLSDPPRASRLHIIEQARHFLGGRNIGNALRQLRSE